MKKSPILKASNIFKTYFTPAQIPVLKGISLEVIEGETIAIMGKSGEGKSTLLHILGTLEKPCSGTLEICGMQTERHPLSKIRNESIGFIFQTFNLLEDYTLLENILLPMKIGRKKTHANSPLYERALSLLEQVDLEARVHFPTKLLSGGEKQRAAIARALANDPQLILADEPSGNLDHANSQKVHELLLKCSKKLHKTLILVTHDPELASLCDKTYILKDGLLT